MTFFDQFNFVVNDQINRYVIKIVNRVNNSQFFVLIDFSNHFNSDSSFQTSFFSKRFFQNIIDIVNNVAQFKQKKKCDRKMKTKNVRRVFIVTSVFYNFTFSVFVNLQSRQTKRRFARFANRVFFFSQSFFQEENDDHDFDDFFFIRSYADFVDHESDQKFEHVSNHDDDEKKNSRLFNRKNKRTYAKKIVRQRVRIRKIDFKTRRDDKSLSFDYMIVRKKDVIFDKHVLSKLHDEHDNNVCFFCDVYQYFEKCHRKFIDDKY